MQRDGPWISMFLSSHGAKWCCGPLSAEWPSDKDEEPPTVCSLVASAFVCVWYRHGEMGSSSFVHIRGEECGERAAMND